WKTQVILINTTDGPINGTLQFYSEGTAAAAGSPLTLNVNGQVTNSFGYVIRARSSANFQTAGVSSVTPQVGSVRISTAGGTAPPASFAVFSFSNNGVTVSQATVS